MINAVLYIILIIIILIFALFFKMNNLTKNISITNIQLLKDYLCLNYKKRNFNKNKLNNNIKNTNKIKNNAFFNILYIKLKHIHISKKIKKYIKEKNKTYVEKRNLTAYKNLYEISLIIEKKINKNKQTYRSINNECLIETIANSFAHLILLKKQFNVYESFRELTSVVKVYKKEADILSYLIISKLINIFIELHKDLLKIKKDVFKGYKLKKYKKINRLSSATIYGIYLKNPNRTKILFSNQDLVINETTKLINELDLIYFKQRIIFNYISYINKSL